MIFCLAHKGPAYLAGEHGSTAQKNGISTGKMESVRNVLRFQGNSTAGQSGTGRRTQPCFFPQKAAGVENQCRGIRLKRHGDSASAGTKAGGKSLFGLKGRVQDESVVITTPDTELLIVRIRGDHLPKGLRMAEAKRVFRFCNGNREMLHVILHICLCLDFLVVLEC